MSNKEQDDILYSAIRSVEGSQLAFFRYITANDTGATGGHQYGFYVGKEAARLLFDQLGQRGSNMEKFVDIEWQNNFITKSRFIYYGVGTRNEYRITRFGKDFPFLQDEYIGSLLVISKCNYDYYKAFVLVKDEEIEAFFDHFNLSPTESNKLINTQTDIKGREKVLLKCLSKHVAALDYIPETKLMAQLARDCYNKVENVNITKIRNYPDKIILGWLDSEFTLFKALEDKIYYPIYSKAFENCQALIDFANSILNSRKSRAGHSLELHLEAIFDILNIEYEAQVITEGNKRPDFIFPSGKAYHSASFPTEKLVFLAAKRTCKDRWRQIINEADRIKNKYLFTLQEGISTNQLREMKSENVSLVVPKMHLNKFPKEFQSEIFTLEHFVGFLHEQQHK